ncbi:MAG: Gfo/Idh/MocA family oxidoreductase [bacterium]
MKKVALVGCGRISKRHIEAITDCDNLSLACVCDIDEKKGKSVSMDIDVPFVKNYNDIKGVDIISVLTPSGLHPKHAIEIAENTDAKYIVVEKPISLTLREAYELYDRVEKAGKVFLPVFQNRYNPLVNYIKKLIDSGKLGRVHQFISDVLWNRNDDYFDIDWHGTATLDGGVLYTQASHYVDMVHYFFGEVEEAHGIGSGFRGFEVYDSVSAVLKFQNGTHGSINCTVNAYGKNYCTEFTLIAEKGTIRLSGTNLNEIAYWNVEGMERPDMEFKIDHVYGNGHNTMYQYIQDEKWEMFPTKEDVLSGIRLMEKLSY